MKNLAFLCSLLVLVACNDSSRTRAPINVNDSVADQDNLEVVTFYTRKDIAQIDSLIAVNANQLVIEQSRSDAEQECVLNVPQATYQYKIVNNVLTLQNGSNSLVLKRTDGPDPDSLIGTWTMTEQLKNSQIITEIIFRNLDEVRIRKTCNY